MKKPIQSQPEGGVDIFKKPEIPKKPRQPEGSGAPKKPIQRQPEGSGAPKKKKIIQRQPEGSGAPKKITGRGEFRDTDKSKKTKTTKVSANKTKTTSAPTSFGQAFAQARKKLGAGKTFTYKGKKYSTNRADDVKKTKTKKTIKPRDKKVMVDSFKKSNVNKNKKPASKMGINGAATTKKKINGGKTGFGTKAMTTKVPKKTRQGITRTPFQAAGQRKRMMGST